MAERTLYVPIWEYKTVENKNLCLPELGASGWEMCGVADHGAVFYFKRPLGNQTVREGFANSK